jgi:hypothetical protein
MRKLRLKLDDLEISSFETQTTLKAHGTVRAHSHNTEFCTEDAMCSAGCTSTVRVEYCPTGGYEVCPMTDPKIDTGL